MEKYNKMGSRSREFVDSQLFGNLPNVMNPFLYEDEDPYDFMDAFLLNYKTGYVDMAGWIQDRLIQDVFHISQGAENEALLDDLDRIQYILDLIIIIHFMLVDVKEFEAKA